jgi:hypothetical protein
MVLGVEKEGENMIYLATPYYHENPKMMVRRFDNVTKAAAWLCEQGHSVYSPITHGHLIDRASTEGIDLEVWKECERTIMPICSELLILLLHQWEKSDGIKREKKLARKFGKQISGLLPVYKGSKMAFERVDI